MSDLEAERALWRQLADEIDAYLSTEDDDMLPRPLPRVWHPDRLCPQGGHAVREIVSDEGTWCRDCEYHEVPDFADGRCMACGCPENRHVEVEVVTK